MSRELYPLYPSNSKVVDLRSKITPAPMSKTKQFFNELQKLSSPTKTASLHMKRAYESERWFSPRIDSDQADTSAPPRRSMFTPSRLQLLSAQRGREMRKPYWRCPMPSTKPNEPETTQSSLVDIITTPAVRLGPIKPFRRREPETGRKTNSFVVDDDILNVDEKEKELMDKVKPLEAPKAGFLGASLVDLFEFSAPLVRDARIETKEIATQTDQSETGSSSGVHTSSVTISEPKSTSGGFDGQIHGSNTNGLSVPVGVVAETISSTQIRLKWIDPNENAFNQVYTIKYGIKSSDETQHKLLNISETEHIFDGLRPDTLYEFAVRLAQSSHWSSDAFSRTLPAQPSPPRDLSFASHQLNGQQKATDPGPVALNWQPPKFTNGGTQAQSDPNPVQFGGFTFGPAPASNGPFQFGPAPAANGPFQFGAAPPVANGNVFQFAETSADSSVSAVRHGAPMRKLLLARRKKR